MKFIGIIPARYGSTRFPGKPLIEIQGKSMIQRVYEQASKALDIVYVATDDKRIEENIQSFGGNCVLTSDQHQSGTDRLAEAIDIIQKSTRSKYDVVVNIQGDEPYIKSEQILQLLGCFDEPNTEIATLVKIIDNKAEIFDINKPKVVFNSNMDALYFSRNPIPFHRNTDKNDWHEKAFFYKHIGMYGYRSEILLEIAKLKPSSLELSESLEQLRWLENGYNIKIAITEYDSFGIDTPDDLERLT